VLLAVRTELEQRLRPITARARRTGPVDEAWYWAAPLLLDADSAKRRTEAWWGQDALSTVWGGDGSDADPDDAASSRWDDHVDLARRVAFGDERIHGRPPDDLAEALASMAVAGPGPTMLRALSRVTGSMDARWVRNAAASSALGFRSLFNQPEVMDLLDGLHPGEPYWRRMLDYCARGGVQAVMDEYVHLALEALGLVDKDGPTAAATIAENVRNVLTLRTPNLVASDVRVTRGPTITSEPQRLRTSFSLRFRDGSDVDDEEAGSRPDQVRQAFNSPFRPFVLATTSVGQEGLDFHQYCHTVVHWNLPSNPVDLEQREGRVHRYKGHAVRKNVVSAHGDAALRADGDPWTAMFEAARSAENGRRSDVVPYWVFEGPAKIERVVPALPLSREAQRIDALRRSLALYRMVFGQPRQDDLLRYLVERVPSEMLEQALIELRIDLTPDVV
jgi:hypothetical protein